MSEDLFDIRGRVFVITGGGGLLGRQYVRALSAAGAHAVVVDIDGEAAREAAAQARGASAYPLAVDITKESKVMAMVMAVYNKYGRVDGLINNAALDPKFDPEHADQHTDAFESFPLEQWQQALDVNLTGMFLCTQAVAPIILEQEKGVVVNISSMYGLVGPDQRLYASDRAGELATYKPITYTVTKSAVLGFTRYLATYWAGTGLRVNTLTLGGVFNDHDEGFLQRYNYRTVLGRMARPDEYNGALIFMLSDAASYMTGANLVVDGGWTAW
jgi:NAD(P)-dependent dehydrogenase (short-subunit alcohol dehydrogenase family)